MKFLPVASEFISEEEISVICQENREKLLEKGYEQISISEKSSYEDIAYFIITGGTERQIMQFVASREENSEIVLIVYSDNNSLAAGLEILARLSQLGRKGRIDLLDYKSFSAAESTIMNVDINLEGARIGVIGAPSDWLVASSYSAEIVKKNCNAELIEIPMDEFFGFYTSNNDATEIIVNDLTSKAKNIIEPDKEDFDKNAKVYFALKKIVDKYNLEALTIRCFDIVKIFKATGCFALSKLNDEGIIAGCEGDITAILGMLESYKRTKKIPWMANPSRLDLENNIIELAHCTVPRTLVQSYTLRSHFETNLGVGIQGYFPTGKKIRLFRLGGENLKKMWQANGEIIHTGNSEKLCRTQIIIRLDDKSITELLYTPLGNHLIVEML
jgi:L-fucose isomerase-like protein